MKKLNIIISTFLCALFIVALSINEPVVAHASTAYTIVISLGNNTDASFDTDALTVNSANKYETAIKTRKTEDGKEVPFKLVISNLAYHDTITFDASKLMVISSGSKYYVKGIRVSGADAMVNKESTAVTLKVENDETYVAAYGVGSVVSYKVQYVDEDGNTLYPEDTLYGAKGEDTIVPARHIRYYSPDAIDKEVNIGDGTVVKFVYSKLPESIEYDITEETSTVYVNGGTTYTYEYEYVDGGTSVRSNTNNRPAVVSNRSTVRGTNTTADTANADDTVNEEALGNADVENATDDTAGNVTIGDESTPAAGKTEIADEEVPEHADDKGSIMVWPIVIAVILSIAVVTIMMVRKKQKGEE